MIVTVLWWMAQCAGLGAIVYVAWWGVNAAGIPEPFGKLVRLAVIIGGVALGIMMVFRLFEILGHPIV